MKPLRHLAWLVMFTSPPLRGRGLKLAEPAQRRHGWRRPPAGAWIETPYLIRYYNNGMSPPLRGRGLKLKARSQMTTNSKSPPLRGRGLKLYEGAHL